VVEENGSRPSLGVKIRGSTFPAKTRETRNTLKNKTTQQGEDGKGTMMVHSRRRIGFHGQQAMESTNN
jgi:hypothetical protein